MQLSVRSQLIAGVAALGATAMVAGPVAQPDLLPSVRTISGEVRLAALADPVSVLFATLAVTGANIFDQSALPEPADLFWPDQFYDFTVDPNRPFLFAPRYVGMIPDGLNLLSTGGLEAVLTNWSGYVNAGIYGVTALVGGVSSAIFNTPFALVTAAGYLAAGRPDLAIAELQSQILAPLQKALGGPLAAIGYLLDNVVTNAQTLITNAIPGLLTNVIATVSQGGLYLLQSALVTARTVVTDLASLQFGDAWNAAVNGLLGPDGVLGQIEQLTLGIGIVQPIDYGPPDGVVNTVVIASLRSDLTSAGQRLGDLSFYGAGGIRNEGFVPPLTVTPAAARSASAEAAPEAEAASVAGVADSAGAADGAEVHPVAGAQTSERNDGPAADSPSGAAGGEDSSVATGTSETRAPAKRDATRTGGRGTSAGD